MSIGSRRNGVGMAQPGSHPLPWDGDAEHEWLVVSAWAGGGGGDELVVAGRAGCSLEDIGSTILRALDPRTGSPWALFMGYPMGAEANKQQINEVWPQLAEVVRAHTPAFGERRQAVMHAVWDAAVGTSVPLGLAD